MIYISRRFGKCISCPRIPAFHHKRRSMEMERTAFLETDMVSLSFHVGIQQFRREVENVLDGSAEKAEAFALLGFGGRQIMKLRNVQSPEVLEETMDKEKSSFINTPNRSRIIIPSTSRKDLSGTMRGR